ncbi:MAG: HAMP domain-containing histidine kinase [Planctomycetes bacterium]|nr:HAMP domain-containing histidine kinase [Planctomycetota bacterium]
MGSGSLRFRLLAASLAVQLSVLLAVMAALLLGERAEAERHARVRAMTERLTVEWAARVDPGAVERFSAGLDFVVETAVLDANRGFTVGKRGPDRTPAEMEAFRREVAELAERALTAQGRALRDGDRMVVPVFADGRFVEARFLRLRFPERDLGPLRTVYLVLLLGAAASMAVTVVALRHWIFAPLREVAEGAARVARGDLSSPVPVHPEIRDEIAAVGSALNAMMAELASYRAGLEDQVGQSVRKARDAEKHLVTAQRLAAMGTLAAGIAHDINNPLGGMINAVRALRKDDLPPAKREEYLALVEEGLERVGQTVQKVLQFTPHRVAPRSCDLAAVADRALALARHRIERSGARVVMEVPESGLPVFGDPYELQQVVLNLLVNAADAVAARGAGGGRVAVRGVLGEGEVRLSVEDDGVGMTEEQVSRAFDLFYTTKEVGEGTGLGLSMVHSILQSHGGRVEIRSRRGEGTTVTVLLPAGS